MASYYKTYLAINGTNINKLAAVHLYICHKKETTTQSPTKYICQISSQKYFITLNLRHKPPEVNISKG